MEVVVAYFDLLPQLLVKGLKKEKDSHDILYPS
jgi:hypothetical protein